MPFWRAHGLGNSARRGRATNRDRRLERCWGQESGARNDGFAAAGYGAPSPSRGRARRRRPAPPQPVGQPQSPFAPLDLVSRDELESIHQAALKVLKEIGIDFLHDEARAMLKERRRRRRSGLAPRALRSRLRRGAHRPRAEGIHAARAQSGARSHDRRAPRRFRHRCERAQFVRPRRRAAARQYARLSELHPPRAEFRFDPFHGAAIRSSRSTFTPPSVISTRCSTC